MINNIKQWGADRGITINGTHEGQWYKLVSEYGELCDNLAKGRDIRDDIGDMFVVLVMICEIDGGNIDVALGHEPKEFQHYDNAYQVVGALHINIGSLRFETDWGAVNTYRVADLISSLRAMCALSGITLEECIEVAYADIAERKGYLTADGVFIKD